MIKKNLKHYFHRYLGRVSLGFRNSSFTYQDKLLRRYQKRDWGNIARLNKKNMQPSTVKCYCGDNFLDFSRGKILHIIA